MPNAGLVSWSRTRSVAQYWLSWSRAIHAGLVATPAALTWRSNRVALAKHCGSTPTGGLAGAASAIGAATRAAADTASVVRRVSRHMSTRLRPCARPLLPDPGVPPLHHLQVTGAAP